MKRSTFTEEQIAYALRQAESGTPVGDVCRQVGVSEATFYAWKKKYAHLGVSELRRLRQVEDANRRLKQLVADLTLAKHILAEALRKKSEADTPSGAGHVVSRHVAGQHRARASAGAATAARMSCWTSVPQKSRGTATCASAKAEAVLEFARVLAALGVEHFQDLPEFDQDGEIATALRAIRGQASGVSIGYFWMLAGSDQLIKPDRMILTFLNQTLNRAVEVEEARLLLAEATALLLVDHQQLTPRLLDYKIWEFQRSRASRRQA